MQWTYDIPDLSLLVCENVSMPISHCAHMGYDADVHFGVFQHLLYVASSLVVTLEGCSLLAPSLVTLALLKLRLVSYHLIPSSSRHRYGMSSPYRGWCLLAPSDPSRCHFVESRWLFSDKIFLHLITYSIQLLLRVSEHRNANWFAAAHVQIGVKVWPLVIITDQYFIIDRLQVTNLCLMNLNLHP